MMFYERKTEMLKDSEWDREITSIFLKFFEECAKSDTEKKRRVPANRAHPDYPEYIEQCKRLQQWYLEESEDLWVPTGVRDGNTALYAAQREHNRRLKELQRKYWYLFEEV